MRTAANSRARKLSTGFQIHILISAQAVKTFPGHVWLVNSVLIPEANIDTDLCSKDTGILCQALINLHIKFKCFWVLGGLFGFSYLFFLATLASSTSVTSEIV